MENNELYCVVFLVICIFLLNCYTKNRSEGFGMDDRPFEPENTLLHRNPWDGVDYQVPSYIKKVIKIPEDLPVSADLPGEDK